MNYFFVSGMLRSGTSLVAAMLNSVPGISCTSDALFESFVNAKSQFCLQHQIEDYHKLSSYFPAKYSYKEVSSFLKTSSWISEYIKSLGLSSQIAGDKEVLCEEFTPYFLQHGIKVIQIVRDPRDVLASIHTGRGHVYTGEHRPVLFDLRNWRKSVAFAILNNGHPYFRLVRYEDLVSNPVEILGSMVQFLKGDSHVELPADVLSQTLAANSSFAEPADSVYTGSVGIWKQALTQELSDFTVQVCLPEMLWLNYFSDKTLRADNAKILSFVDPFENTRKEFQDFDYGKEKLQEIARLESLESESTSGWNGYFIDENVYKELKASRNEGQHLFLA